MTDQPPSDALTVAVTAADLAYSEPHRARRLADAALLATPHDAEVASAARRALGMAAAATGDLADATQHLQRAAEIADAAGLSLRAGQARGSLAYVTLLTTGAEAALRELDRADVTLHDGAPAARLQMQRGLVLSELRRFDEAAVSLDRALTTLDRAGGEVLLEADIRNNRAIVHMGTRNWADAHDELRRAEALYLRGDHPGRTAMVCHNRAIIEGLRGDLPAALALFDEAGTRYRAAGLDPGLLSVDRAEALLGVRLVAEARQAAELAVAEFARRRNAVDVVQARLLVAEAALLADDPDTALAEADRARRSAQRQGRPRWAALAGHLRLQARWRSGERSTASLRIGTRIARELDDAGWPVQALDARLVVARTALALDRRDAARAQLRRIGSARHSGPAELRVRAWHAEAILRRYEGDRSGAARAARTGLDILDEFQASLGATDLRAHAFAHADSLARFGVQLAVESGRPDAIFAAAERGRAGALRFRPPRPPDDVELAADLSELRQVVTELRSDEVTERDPLFARQRVLEQAIRDRARHAGGSAGRSVRVPAVAALRAALGAATLVEYVEVDGELHALIMSAGRFSFHHLGTAATAERSVDALRSGLRWLAFGVGSARSMTAMSELVTRSAGELDELLLGPLGTLRAPDAPLVIVPTGALHALPWSALPSCAARAVSVAPSAALWHRAATDGTGGGRTVLAHGPGLRTATAEVADLARAYPGATSLLGDDARVAPLLVALDGAGIAHLAAHGHFRADNPMFSELEFADGPLTVYDLERLARPPRHVVLASCDSGLARVSTGDELIGLAAALLAMGTVTLVAAVVPVPDEASQALMLRLHEHVRAGRAAADALRLARIDTIAPPHTPAALAAAAGFVCFGAGGQR